MSHLSRRSFVSASLLLAVLAGTAMAGPLMPPAGAVGATGKTLTEVEPRIAVNATNTPGNVAAVYRITQPGSYYLTGNVAAVGKNGIEIAADGVTVDLGGFAISGSDSASSGITVTGVAATKVTIHNGTIENFIGSAVSLGMPNVTGAKANVLRDLRIIAGAADGVIVGPGALVEDCTVRGTATGIWVGSESVVRRCSVSGAAGTGLRISGSSMVSDCVVSGCGIGIDLGSGSTARSCSVASSAGVGITSSDGVNIESCTVVFSGTDGISMGWGSRARGCLVNSNGRDGIVFGSYCTIEGNHLRGNGSGAGITTGAALHAKTGSASSRIAGNFCTQGDRGLWIQGTTHTVVNNDASANAINYVIDAGNRVGTIVLPAASVAISGNSGGGSGTTDPMANLAH